MFATCIHRSAQTASDASKKVVPVLWHYLERPLPYRQGLALQEALVSRRVDAKNALQAHEAGDGDSKLSAEQVASASAVAAQDVLLLLEHTPVYTTGRRETDPETLEIERERLTKLGAEYIATQRGGQTTYHGPGQLVGYPIFDTEGLNLSTRCYVQRISDFLERLLVDKFDVPLLLPPPQVGAYPTSTSKVGSIGIQIRRRITSHGFSLNVTAETRHWFDQIIACGSPDVKATSVEAELRRLGKYPPSWMDRKADSDLDKADLRVKDTIPLAVQQMQEIFKKDFKPLMESQDAELRKLIHDVESSTMSPHETAEKESKGRGRDEMAPYDSY